MNPPEAKRKISPHNYTWGVAGIAENFLSFGLAWTLIPVFNIGYGVNAFWLGVVIFLPRVLDVITDPLMGIISDRTRSRFGRRRPYIFVGAILMAFLFALLWMPPYQSLNGAAVPSNDTFYGLPAFPQGDELKLLIWIGVIYSLLTIAFTVFSVPYAALGYEFTDNYDEVTKIMLVRLYCSLFASLGVNWMYSLSVSDMLGGDETVGMRYVGAAVALIVMITGILPALFCTESSKIERPKQNFQMKELMEATLKNRAFITVMFAMMIFVMGMYTAGVMAAHINIYYVAAGDKAYGAQLGAIAGNISIGANFVGMYLMMKLSNYLSKKTVVLLSLAIIFIATVSFWWTWNPEFPELQYLSAAINGFGYAGIWLMLDSMIADVAKDDEARNGVQREGIFGASKSFIFKIAVAVTSLTGALVLSVSGYQEGILPSDEVLESLRFLYIGIQCVGIILAVVAIIFFPIGRARALENEDLITARKRQLVA